jgi:uncharacterized membrane protein YkoI
MGLFNFLFGKDAAGSDGASPETAIVVSSVEAEYKWVQRNCPGYRFLSQSLQEINGTMYDVLELQNRQGEERTVYFDITQFFGK